MKLENQDDYIKYRFKRAEESFDDALDSLVTQIKRKKEKQAA